MLKNVNFSRHYRKCLVTRRSVREVETSSRVPSFSSDQSGACSEKFRLVDYSLRTEIYSVVAQGSAGPTVTYLFQN